MGKRRAVFQGILKYPIECFACTREEVVGRLTLDETVCVVINQVDVLQCICRMIDRTEGSSVMSAQECAELLPLVEDVAAKTATLYFTSETVLVEV